ncbi:hypothetical protein L7F22_029276 [Adiantum nelumboides]|nr:hypothetical protein [Adiantum nelumboides]
MGGNMRDRLRAAGHEVVGYDPRPEVSDVGSLDELAAALTSPRVVWVMVPSGDPTRSTVTTLSQTLSAGDLVIDGGNSRYTDDGPNAELLDAKGIGYVDCGVSGGIWGKDNGYGLMAGGSDEHIALAMPIFDALRPEGPREEGFAHAGPSAPGTSRRWSTTASSVVARHRRPVVAAGPAGQRAAPGRRPLRAGGVRRRLRRGPVDDRGGDPARRPAAGDLRGAVRAVLLAPGRVAGDEGGGRAAPPVRRARGEGGRPGRRPRRQGRPLLGHRLDRAVLGLTGLACTCGVSRSPTSGPGPRPSSSSTPA